MVSPELAERSGAEDARTTYAGRRMSGQVVEVALVRLPRLRVGDVVADDLLAGVLDLGGGDEFSGILTPAAFGERPLTLDGRSGVLTVGEPGGTTPGGAVVEPHEHRDGPAVDWSVDLVLPSGRTVRVEVDTGSGALILDTSLLGECGLTLDDPAVEMTTGTDETGHDWIRRWARIEGSVHLADAPGTAQDRPRVMFQDIRLDGLVGTDYLDRFVTTYDLGRRELVLGEESGIRAG